MLNIKGDRRNSAVGALTAGTQTVGTLAAGTQTAGTQAAGTQTAGAQTVGTQTVGMPTAGTSATGMPVAATQPSERRLLVRRPPKHRPLAHKYGWQSTAFTLIIINAIRQPVKQSEYGSNRLFVLISIDTPQRLRNHASGLLLEPTLER